MGGHFVALCSINVSQCMVKLKKLVYINYDHYSCYTHKWVMECE